jgi:hypothetical protein
MMMASSGSAPLHPPPPPCNLGARCAGALRDKMRPAFGCSDETSNQTCLNLLFWCSLWLPFSSPRTPPPEAAKGCCYLSMVNVSLRLKLARFSGSRASPAAAQSAPTSQKTAETSAPEPKAAPCSACRRPSQNRRSSCRKHILPCKSRLVGIVSFPSHSFCSFVFCCLSFGSQLPADSTEFHLMQQIRGNLNGFDCDVSALPAESLLIRC